MSRSRRCTALLAVAWFALAGSACQAPRSESVASGEAVDEIRATLDALYVSFCFDAGGQADWERMRSLLVEGAAFVPPIRDGREDSDEPVRAVDADTFVGDFREWIATSPEGASGFHERIVHARVDVFGNVAHAYVSFEGFVPGDGETRTSGLDSIQLVRDRGRWLVASFTTQYAGDGVSVPKRFTGR